MSVIKEFSRVDHLRYFQNDEERNSEKEQEAHKDHRDKSSFQHRSQSQDRLGDDYHNHQVIK